MISHGERPRHAPPRAPLDEPLEPRLLLAASLVTDINLNTEPSHPARFAQVGNLLYFSADDGVTGHELWRTDGTDAGTSRVADAYPGPASSRPNNITNVNGRIFFTTVGTGLSSPNPNGGGLWVTDGTDAGTRKLSAAVLYSSLVPAGDLVYFRARDSEAGYELWVSDGTEAGTRRLKDINPGPADSMPLDFHAAVGNVLYFNATSPFYGNELWRTDGTEAGTHLVKDVNPNTADAFDANSSMLAGPGGKVYFVATTAAKGTELWKTDGTDAGTVIVSDILLGLNGSSPRRLSMVGGALYFDVAICCNARTLFRTDGTGAGTVAVKDFFSGPDQIPVDISRVYELNGAGYFWTQARLWRTDGTTAGTVAVTQPNVDNPDQVPQAVVKAGNDLYFVTPSRYFGLHALWRTNGTAAGTLRLTPQNFQHTGVAALGNSVIFGEGELKIISAADSAPRLLKDINAATPYGSNPQFFRSAGPYVYFLTRWSPGPTRTYRLWRTDGTESGTIEIFDTGHDPFNTDLSDWDSAALGSSVVFSIGSKVWIAGPGPGSQRVLMDAVHDVSPMFAIGGKVYFAVQNQGTTKLWVTDGQTVQPLADVPLSYLSRSGANDLVAVGDTVYFTGIDAGSNAELWRTDGTPSGTRAVKDLIPGAQGAHPRRMVDVNGTLFFMAQAPGGSRWWRSDGTTDGTVPLPVDVLPYAGFDSWVDPKFSAAVGGVLYFAGVLPDSTSGIQLWRTDGTAEGTYRVGGITGGPTELTAFGDRLLYAADKILYVTDGIGRHDRALHQPDRADLP